MSSEEKKELNSSNKGVKISSKVGEIKTINLSNLDTPIFNYFLKVSRLKTIFEFGNISNKDKYQSQLADIEQEVKEQIHNGKEKSIDFDKYNQRLDEIISLVDKESKEYQTRKQNALMEVLTKNDELVKEKRELDDKVKAESIRIKGLRVDLAKVASIVGAFTLITPIFGAGGVALGTLTNESIAYKKTANSYIAKTHEPVGDSQITYDIEKYDYKIIVKVCSPWVEGEFTDGYSREVIEYEFIGNGNKDEVNIEQMLKSGEAKYYMEAKKTLDSKDSTEQREVIITEITNDKSDYKITEAGYGYMALLGVLCGVIGGLITYLCFVCSSYDLSDLKYAIRELRDAKITRKQIKESYEQIGDKVILLQTECQKDSDEYLELLDKISPELLKTADKFRK